MIAGWESVEVGRYETFVPICFSYSSFLQAHIKARSHLPSETAYPIEVVIRLSTLAVIHIALKGFE